MAINIMEDFDTQAIAKPTTPSTTTRGWIGTRARSPANLEWIISIQQNYECV